MRDAYDPWNPLPMVRKAADPYRDLPTCPLCQRPMLSDQTTDRHHLIPRSKGGTEMFLIHRICHSKIHSVFTRQELAETYNTFEKLREHPDIQSFVRWLAKKDPAFVGKNYTAKAKGRR